MVRWETVAILIGLLMLILTIVVTSIQTYRRGMLDTEIAKAKYLDERLSTLVNGLALPSDKKTQISAACISIALDHHRGIVVLVERQVYPPASALLRSLAEAYLRGCWFFFCCNSAELDRFIVGAPAPGAERIIQDLERHPAFATGVLRQVKDRTWSTMCDFTHTGIGQIVRNLNDGEIAAAYDEDELIELLAAANSWALLAGHTLAGMAGEIRLAEQFEHDAFDWIPS